MSAADWAEPTAAAPTGLRGQWYLMKVAVVFMTRIPVPIAGHVSAADIARASRYYPLVGLLVGLCVGGFCLLARQFFPTLLAATLAMVAGAIVTGAFHEDALGDVADAFGGGMTPERKLEIMKDSRLGTYGSFALFAALLIRIQCLALIDSGVLLLGVSAMHALSRCGMVWLLYRAPRARTEGLGAGAQHLTLTEPVVATLIAVAVACLCLPALQLAGAITACVAGTLAVWHLAHRHVGGITGDVLGSTQQVGEIGALLVLVAMV